MSQKSFEPKQFGRYLLIDKLAVGGMAEIYKAKTYGVDGFEKLLAIKRILPHCAADKEFITMLVDEAKLTVLLSHANIVQVYDLGKVGDDYYISMEFIHGTNLREMIRRIIEEEGKIPEELAVYIVSEICKGLDYAHRKTSPDGQLLNIVHRDINPQNILISFEGEVKIVDFGIAKAAMNVSHTMAGVLKGKIAYMSPEQALGKPLDGRTDIYSAGLVLYEMLTGKKFYTGETQFEILNKIRTTRVNTMDLPEGIPGPLKAIIAKSLAFNAKDRYQTAGDLHLELTKYLYSSYIDFSPRNLAALVRKFFNQEMRANEESGPIVDEKTRSLLIKANTAESLVDDDEDEVENKSPADTNTEIGKREETAFVSPLPDLGAEPSMAAKPPKKKRKWMALLLLIALAGGAYLGWSQFGLDKKFSQMLNQLTGSEDPVTPPKPIEPPVKEDPDPKPLAKDFGAIIVSSEPNNASILLNGKNIGKRTPATLTRLALGKEYSIKVVLKHHEPYERTVSLVTEEPVQVHTSLKALAEGAIKVDSDPKGAKIFLNGKDTGKVTPTTIDGLAIKEDYTIKLQKEGFGEWTSTVPLENFSIVNLRASLVKIPEIPEPPKAPEVIVGSLEVRSVPGNAKVFINGKDTGQVTPTQLDELQLEKFYTIKLVKSGHSDFVKSVQLTEKSGEKLVATLKEVKAAPKPIEKPKPKPTTPIAKPTPKPKPTYTPPPKPPEPVASGKPATLQIRSDPSGAEVYVNSEYKGTTPVKISGLNPGTARVMLRKHGYLRHQSSVRLNAGEKKSVGTIKMEGLYGEIKVETTPPRADVIFNGQKIGATTPVTIRRVPRDKNHSLKVQLRGYSGWQSSVDMSREAVKRYNIRLKKN